MTPPPCHPNLVQEPRGRAGGRRAPSQPSHWTGPCAYSPGVGARGGKERPPGPRATRRGLRSRPLAPGRPAPRSSASRLPCGRCLTGPRRSVVYPPSPTTHLPRSRGSRRNSSARRTPRRGMKSGAGRQRRGSAPDRAPRPARGARAASPGRPCPLPSGPPPPPRPLPPRCGRFRLAAASLPGCGACPVRRPARPRSPRRAGPLLRVFTAAGGGAGRGRCPGGGDPSRAHRAG